MKPLNSIYCLAFLLFNSLCFAQERNHVFVKGKIVEAATNTPLEYASVTLKSTTNAKNIHGNATDASGNFNIPVKPDTYQIKIEYLGYKTFVLDSTEISTSTNLGVIKIEEESEVLEGVVIKARRPDIELKSDKRIYNIANSNIVRGRTASDVLDNIPSVEVNAEGNVSLRGNESVKILIDGKPSGLSSNVGDALKMISAESLDRVEVITNPSARYEADGSGGIINIIKKKGKNDEIGGSISFNAANPLGYGATANLNMGKRDYNLYSNLGYTKNKAFGNSINETQYLNEDSSISQYVNEYAKNIRKEEAFNGNIGFAWNLTDRLIWNQELTYRRSNGDNPRNVNYDSYDADYNLSYSNIRQTEETDFKETFEYTADLTYKFNGNGHQLLVSGSMNRDKGTQDADISTLNDNNLLASDLTNSLENQLRYIARVDYVLPLNEHSKFEAGYLGNFYSLDTKFDIQSLDNAGNYVPNEMFQNDLAYRENIHALFTQYENKFDKFNLMIGLRWEATEIDINQHTTMNFNNKRYNNFFPSAFLSYEFTDRENLSISYSRHIRRPQSNMLNPFSNYSSSINFYQGNPDLNPAFTDMLELGYLKRWGQLTFNASTYYNKRIDGIQFVSRVDGVNDENIPILISTPVNFATEHRYGVELNLNYTPTNWWSINANSNLFIEDIRADYNYTDIDENIIEQNFDNITSTWRGRFNSQVSLPLKIDWQTIFSFRLPQTTAQSRVLGEYSVDMALSRDFFNDNVTLALNVQDLFNSRKRKLENFLPQALSYVEMQGKERTINVSFAYRFNQKKRSRNQ